MVIWTYWRGGAFCEWTSVARAHLMVWSASTNSATAPQHLGLSVQDLGFEAVAPSVHRQNPTEKPNGAPCKGMVCCSLKSGGSCSQQSRGTGQCQFIKIDDRGRGCESGYPQDFRRSYKATPARPTPPTPTPQTPPPWPPSRPSHPTWFWPDLDLIQTWNPPSQVRIGSKSDQKSGQIRSNQVGVGGVGLAAVALYLL